jgi:hypothetical protein
MHFVAIVTALANYDNTASHTVLAFPCKSDGEKITSFSIIPLSPPLIRKLLAPYSTATSSSASKPSVIVTGRFLLHDVSSDVDFFVTIPHDWTTGHLYDTSLSGLI